MLFPQPFCTGITLPIGRPMSSRSSTGAGEAAAVEAEEQVARAVNSELKARRRASGKASISRAQPLKAAAPPAKPDKAFRQAWRRTAGELSEAEQRAAVEQALEVFRLLPPASSYAQHRIRVLEKALQLLDKARWAGARGVGGAPAGGAEPGGAAVPWPLSMLQPLQSYASSWLTMHYHVCCLGVQ